jgi:hypothetical protein
MKFNQFGNSPEKPTSEAISRRSFLRRGGEVVATVVATSLFGAEVIAQGFAGETKKLTESKLSEAELLEKANQLELDKLNAKKEADKIKAEIAELRAEKEAKLEQMRAIVKDNPELKSNFNAFMEVLAGLNFKIVSSIIVGILTGTYVADKLDKPAIFFPGTLMGGSSMLFLNDIFLPKYIEQQYKGLALEVIKLNEKILNKEEEVKKLESIVK